MNTLLQTNVVKNIFVEIFFNSFYELIGDDPRIGATHISVYMALLYHQQNENKNPFTITREIIMKAAKINGRQTYNRCMNDLQGFGYIKYTPSSNPFEGSIICLKEVLKKSVKEI